MNNPTFTDKCALERGLAVVDQNAPLFSAHLAAIKENMERVAEQTARMGFPQTAKAMMEVARDL